MEPTSQMMVLLRQTIKFYAMCLEDVRREYQLTKLEVSIISFLTNNPGKDTVADIAEGRILSRGNVSRGVDSLQKQGFLERVPDQRDRRWVHLHLLPEAEPVCEAVRRSMEAFHGRMFADFTPEEQETWRVLRDKIARNLEQGMQGIPSPAEEKNSEKELCMREESNKKHGQK